MSIIIPRLPSMPKFRTGNPWTDDGDIYAECGVPGCDVYGGTPYHTMGSRATVKHAMDDHHRLCHSQEAGVVLLNHPRQ